MGKHSKHVARGYRGRHRAPTTAGRNVARVTAAGAIAAFPVTAVSPAFAAENTEVRTVAVATANGGGFDHDQIARCESGGSASAQNSSSSASGLYQFIDSTWKAYGGSTARAKDASVSEQRRVAERAFAAEGYSPWNASKSCWGGKTGSGEKVTVTGEAQSKPVAKSKSTKQRVVKERVSTKAEKTVAPTKKHVTPKRTKVATGKSIASHHTVKSGETLSGIAERVSGATWSDLYSYNRDTIGSNPHLIVPGQVLKVVK